MLLCVVAIGLLSGCGSSEEPDAPDEPPVELPSGVEGVWEGRLFQEYEDHSWDVRVALDATAASFQAEYPTLGCSAGLEPEEREGEEVRFQHRIVEGEMDCLDPGIVVLNLMEGELYYGYFSSEDQRFRAYGLLQEETSPDQEDLPLE